MLAAARPQLATSAAALSAAAAPARVEPRRRLSRRPTGSCCRRLPGAGRPPGPADMTDLLGSTKGAASEASWPAMPSPLKQLELNAPLLLRCCASSCAWLGDQGWPCCQAPPAPAAVLVELNDTERDTGCPLRVVLAVLGVPGWPVLLGLLLALLPGEGQSQARRSCARGLAVLGDGPRWPLVGLRRALQARQALSRVSGLHTPAQNSSLNDATNCPRQTSPSPERALVCA